jgi:methylmalonyl-CoA mutase cobalamin-binding subunit
MNEHMNERNLDIPWFVGGNIPSLDVQKLEAIGANKAFPTGSKVLDVVKYFNELKVKI